MTIYTSYKVSKKLKEFLGESAPSAFDNKWWSVAFGVKEIIHIRFLKGAEYPENIPAYRLEDLLSKPFCEAFVKCLDVCKWPYTIEDPKSMAKGFCEKYYDGGMEAVEKALLSMTAK